MRHIRKTAGVLAALIMVCAAAPAFAQSAMQDVLDYVRSQNTTGFLVIREGQVLAEANWPAPPGAGNFQAAFVHGTTASGALLEDVASQQKSFVAVLAAIAVDKGLLDVGQPVSRYLGAGWSKATPEQEAAIRVVDVLTMSSGLDEGFAYVAPPGRVFFYNTPVYAVTKRVLEAAVRRPLDEITREWLTGPAGMSDTGWRRRPAALGDVGNPTGLVTTPRDVARFGQLVLDRGRAADGRRVVSEAQLAALFERSAANPAYGRLWWLNGGAYAIRPGGRRADGPLIPSAPADLVAALGALDRKLYVSPGRKLVVVRLGAAAPDKTFDETLWRKLSAALEAR
ncbi:serine hydrolase domain-containing protein [Phenylobacterium sp. VNQ135]|uniref:serine hydrolase domain-containing protein n=1 Tax=Phenylobacterium sp. VNQ135 TaxID=3400922 RepID=UPI003C0687EF